MSVKLKITSGPMSGKDFEFKDRDVFIFGRSSDCQCCLPDDEYISRHHFLLEVNPRKHVLKTSVALTGLILTERSLVEEIKVSSLRRPQREHPIAM